MLGIILILLSGALYIIHYVIFKDSHHIFIYLLGDIAFVPIEVLLVTLVIDQLLKGREQRSLLNKLNMVIGVFFTEVGTPLLRHFSAFDTDLGRLKEKLKLDYNWSTKHFTEVKRYLKHMEHEVDSTHGSLGLLKGFLLEKRTFLLMLLENPNLLEHESFTELLWAVTHVSEELMNREDVYNLPVADYKHLSGDIKRAYVLLITEWLSYLHHLRQRYPYLYSLAVRTNPFNPDIPVTFI